MAERRGLFGAIRRIGHALFPAIVPERPRRAVPPEPPREPPRRRRRFTTEDEVLTSIPGFGDMDEDEQDELREAYREYMIRGRSPYKRQDVRNPFWSFSGISPRDFDWDTWRQDLRNRTGTP